MWVGIRTGMWLWMLGMAWLSGFEAARRASDPVGWGLGRLIAWDAGHYIRIVENGYNANGATCCDQVFFPGYPLAVRAMTPLFLDVRIAALAVPVVAGTIAAMLLWRITSEEFGANAGRHAVALLAVTPYGLFLSVPYSESLFLALTLTTWYAARRQLWWWAAAAASAAALVRVNGLFVAVALVVMWLAARRTERSAPRSAAVALLLPFATAGTYAWYLYSRSWLSWTEAQESAWKRHVDWPWKGFAASWQWLTNERALDLRFAGMMEPLVVLAGVVLVVLLARRRRWAEFVYVGLSVGVLLFSNSFMSAPRFAVVWFPAFVLAGAWLARDGHAKWAMWVYGASIMGLAVTSLAFTASRWVA
jgi:hypothetical protein